MEAEASEAIGELKTAEHGLVDIPKEVWVVLDGSLVLLKFSCFVV